MHAAMRSNFLAQASIETLIVFLIFLSAFAIVYAASSRLAAGAQSHLDKSISQSSFSDFSAKLQSACALGSGNVREVQVKGAPASLSQEAGGKSVTFVAGAFTATANSTCEISLASSEDSHFFRIENKDGVLEIT